MLGNYGIVEFGFSSKLQADQDFSKVDETFGVNSWLWLHNDIFDSITKGLSLYDGKRGTKGHFEAVLPPRIILGYDYVTHLKNDGSAKTGNNRLVGSIAWDFPLASNVEITGLPFVDQIKGVTLVTSYSGIYDLDKSSYAPEAHISLDFLLSTSDKVPTISLSWVNGKTAPKFEHFDAFLAGFKMKF